MSISHFQFAVLGSGSKGNSLVFRAGDQTVLIDAGMSCKQLCLRLDLLGVDADNIDAVLLTHEHTDHTGALDVFCKERQVPIYSNARTRHALEQRFQREKVWRLFETGAKFSLGDILIESFSVVHDAAEPVGFRISYQDKVLGVATDVGFVTNLCREVLKGCHALFLEANYDPTLLEQDLKRPWAIKQRIMGRHGHLSNADAALLITDIAKDTLGSVVLGHLSSDCNEAELARSAVIDKCKEVGLEVAEKLEVVVSSQEKSTDWIQIESKKDKVSL